jgi:hypothetical protein
MTIPSTVSGFLVSGPYPSDRKDLKRGGIL